MVHKISPSIKIKVLNEWLQGTSRYQIAKANGIGTGTVTGIVQQAKNNHIPDIDLMRKLALMLREEGLDVNHFASAVRLKRVLDKIGLPEEDLEFLIEDINIQSLHLEMDTKEFLSKLAEILQMAFNLDMSVSDLLGKFSQMKTSLAVSDNK